jgi:Na+-transporting methylmalonyl-CoA/oxaloacetate decarboxylase gamma subunit
MVTGIITEIFGVLRVLLVWFILGAAVAAGMKFFIRFALAKTEAREKKTSRKAARKIRNYERKVNKEKF